MLANARDVGGLSTEDGRRVRSGILFRSDAPHAGDAAPPLSPWPPQWVVDLRSPGEINGAAHPLAAPGTEVLRRPLLAVADPLKMAEAVERGGSSLQSIYAEMVRVAGPLIAEVAGIVAASEGPVLVHCTAGKDRTGVVVAALLAAVGVPDDQIAADYVTTAQNMDGVVARVAASWPEDKRARRLARLTQGRGEILGAPREAIDIVLDSLRGQPLSGAARRGLQARLLATE
jgi:protein-tyrosine phosphatase